MLKPHKVPLYVSLKNVELLYEADALLEHIDVALASLERKLTVLECRITIEGADAGPCGVRLDVTFPRERQASFKAKGRNLFRAVDGAFDACGRISPTGTC